MSAYANLTRLPPPTLGAVDVRGFVTRIAALEQRLMVAIAPGPDVVARADADQLD